MSKQQPANRQPETSGTDEVRFHYSRAERTQHRSSFEPIDHDQRRRKLTRRLVIIVLDIVLVSAVYLIYVFFLQPDPSSAQLGGIRVSSNAGYFDNILQVRVTAERVEASEQPGLIAVKVLESGTDHELGSELDTIGSSSGDSRTLYFQLGPLTALPEAVDIAVDVDGESIRLQPVITLF